MDVAEAVESAEVDPTADADDFLSFWEFFRDLYVPEQRPDLPLKPAHEKICDTLQQAFLGTLPPIVAPDGTEHPVWFIILNLPPRIGKTTIAQGCGCWGTGYYPDSQWIYTSYSGDLAEGSLDNIAQALRSEWFTQNYGDKLHSKRADRLATVDGGQLFAEGVAGSLTGKGAGLKRPAGGMIFIDDPAKPDDVLSPVMAESVRFWFENTLLSRRNSDQFTPIVIIAQRLGPGDLPGYVQKTYPQNTLTVEIAALVDADGNPANISADGPTEGIRSQFPETVSAEALLALRKTRTGRFTLAAQYQQKPVAFGGNLIQPDTFRRFNPRDVGRFNRLVITVDTAMKTKQANDFSAVEAWGEMDRHAYLIDLMHGKWESPELLANVKLFWEKWCNHPLQPRPELMIEEKAAGTGLIQQLSLFGIPTTGIERDIDKVKRVKGILPFIESGFVHVPQDGTEPWIEKFLTECSEFSADGTAEHDDMVDAMTDGIEQLLGRGLSIFDVLLAKK